MAREVTKVEQYGSANSGDPRRYVVASTAAIAKGTFLKFADARTATASTGTGDVFAGFAAMQKKNDDYSTSISAWTNGIYTCTASLAITAGQLVQTAAPGNYVIGLAVNTASTAIVVGVALDTVADGEEVEVRVNI